MTAPNAFTARIAPITFTRSQQARVLRSIDKQPPQHDRRSIALHDADQLAAAKAVRSSQFEAQKRARRL